MLSFITCLLLMISLNICISISNGIPALTVQISMKTDPYSALDKPQKHTLRGRTSGRPFTLSASPGIQLRNLPSHCVCGKTFSIDHALSCPKGGFISLRHNELRDFTAKVLAAVSYTHLTLPTIYSV